MSVSIAEMERVALGNSSRSGHSGQDFGNIIDLGDFGSGGDLGDDLGLSLISNPTKVTVNTSGSGSSGSHEMERPSVSFAPSNDAGKSISIQSFAPSSSLGIDISPLEPITMDGPIDLNSFGAPPVEVKAVQESSFNLFGNAQSSTAAPSIQLASVRNPEEEKKEKSELMNKLQRLEAKGFPVSRKYTMDNSLEEMKTEYFRLVDARQLETSIKFQRQMLIGAITGMEWLNGKFDPFDVKLDGWSESVHENVEDFDEIFEELYDKYKDKGKMSPEMRLVMAVGGSGFMCHVSNTFFRSKMPSMDDVLRKNPELAKQMAAAAAQQAGPGFGNFMGMAMGAEPPGVTPPGMGPFSPPPPPSTGAFFGSSAAAQAEPRMPQAQTQAQAQAAQKPTARREMAGPSGVEDILKTFEEVRRAESQALPVYTSQPAVEAATRGAASVISEDMSYSESINTGTGSAAGRRRRRAQPPSGSTISLNV
jgi:hypothetical protein